MKRLELPKLKTIKKNEGKWNIGIFFNISLFHFLILKIYV